MLIQASTLSAIISLLLLPFFFVAGPDYYSSDSYKYFWNFGHPLFFSLANFALLKILFSRSTLSIRIQCLVAIVFTATVGITTELIQAKFSRDPDLGDLSRNFLGLAIALFWFSPQRYSLAKYIRYSGQVICLLALCFMFWVVTGIYIAEYERQQRLPILLNFEKVEDIEQVKSSNNIRISSEVVSEGQKSLKVHLNTGRYSGLAIRKIPSDWSRYQYLALSLYNPLETPIKLTLRIDDITHSRNPKGYSDRFNRRIKLVQGWTHWSIPLADIASAPRTRSLNLNAISNIGLFSSRLSEARIIYLDNVRLLNKPSEKLDQ